MNRLPSHDQKLRPCPEPQLELRWHTSACSHLAPRRSSFCMCQKVYLKGKWTSWHHPPGPGNVLHPSFLYQLSVVNFLSAIWNGLETGPQMRLLQSGLDDGCWCIFTPFPSWLMISLWNPQIRMQAVGESWLSSAPLKPYPSPPPYPSFLGPHFSPCTSVPLSLLLSEMSLTFSHHQSNSQDIPGHKDKMNIWW